MADAKRDSNYVTTLIAVSNVDGVTPVVLYADPTTHRLLVDSSGGGANTALSNLASVAINESLLPGTSDAVALGSTTKMWSDLFLASGAVINFNNGNVTITHSAGVLTVAGGNLALGTNSLTMTGSIGATGARVTKVWTADLESTNMPTVGGTSLSSTFAPQTSPTFATSITGSYLTASEMLITDASKNIVSAPVATYPSLTELTYLKGVTSAIQTQLNAKQASDAGLTDIAGLAVTDGNIIVGDGANWVAESGATARTSLGLGTGDSPQFTGIELGHATDTTITRSSAGIIAVEGVAVPTISSTDTLSNKTLTAPKFADLGFIADANGNELIVMDTVASAVNEIKVANAATGGAPEIAAQGGDANISLQLTPKGTGIVKGELKRFMVRILDSATALTTGTTKGGDFRISSRAITVKAVGAYVDTAATGATLVTIDINEAGVSIISTKITIDASEKSSETAATPPVISDSAIAADAVITFDVDAVGNTTPGNGLTVWIDYVYA